MSQNLLVFLYFGCWSYYKQKLSSHFGWIHFCDSKTDLGQFAWLYTVVKILLKKSKYKLAVIFAKRAKNWWAYKEHKKQCNQGLILPTKIICSEKFSVKIRKLWLHQIFQKSLKNFLGSVLTWLINYLHENVLHKSSMGTQFEISVSIFRNLKICTEYRGIFLYFWLVGLSPGFEL